jgi:hypothetical protein
MVLPHRRRVALEALRDEHLLAGRVGESRGLGALRNGGRSEKKAAEESENTHCG